jgi:hypothetical protein
LFQKCTLGSLLRAEGPRETGLARLPAKKALEMFILLRAQLAQLAQPANLKKRSTLFEMDCSLSHQPAERNIDYGKNRDSD